MSQATTVRQMRAQLDGILDRARMDSEFGERLNLMPEATLKEAGLDSRAVPEVAREVECLAAGRLGSDDYLQPISARPCDFTTCWISWCDHWGTFVTS
jgi:hypothetical protein